MGGPSGNCRLQHGAVSCRETRAEAEIAAAHYPQMRLFIVPTAVASEPVADIEAAWAVCSPETVGAFSAVGYYYGRELHRRLGVPIGLVHTAWGGTVAEAWTSRGALLAVPDLATLVTEFERDNHDLDAALAAYEERRRAWAPLFAPEDEVNEGLRRGWAAPGTGADGWGTMPLPCTWQAAGLDYSGVFWFRKEVDLPAAWSGRTLTLSLGAIDKGDITYVNGVRVGGLSHLDREDSWNTRRVYTVPGELARAGRNTIAVRAYSHVYAGGLWGPAHAMNLRLPGAPDAAPISLAGDWRYSVERNMGPALPPPGPENPNWPAALFNAMIAPLLPYAIRGAIWYQGESNADRAFQYRSLFPTMIRDWRRAWAQGDFPFYFVQLANYFSGGDSSRGSAWAELREAQAMTLALPNTGMAVITDVGEALDIHPADKQTVGHRLALNALAQTYGQGEVEFSGPRYRGRTIEGSAIRLAFDHAAGLTARGLLDGFTIAGGDGSFAPAQARIDGETVVVSSPAVPVPVAVRYAWSDNPPCTLYNAAGLPASPFRTDECPGVTQHGRPTS